MGVRDKNGRNNQCVCVCVRERERERDERRRHRENILSLEKGREREMHRYLINRIDQTFCKFVVQLA